MKALLVFEEAKESTISGLLDWICLQSNITVVEKPNDAEVIFIIGGDGLMTRAAKSLDFRGKRLYGVNRGTYGFLLNDHADTDDFIRAVDNAEWLEFPLLRADIEFINGTEQTALAFNEVYTKTAGAQSAKHKLLIDGNDIIPDGYYSGDGIMVCTPGGSTAYNRSAKGIILDHNSSSLELTPICPFLPMEFSPQLLSGQSIITIEMLEDAKREHLVIADNVSFKNVRRVIIQRAAITTILGFKPDNSYFRKTLELRFPWLKGKTLKTKI